MSKTSEAQQVETVIVAIEGDEYDDEDGWGDTYRKAAHMLHEQAHGTETAWRFCAHQPCRDLPDRTTGPASSSSVGLF